MNNPQTILYVEDDDLVFNIYHKRLQAAGYNVVPARDGIEAIKQLSIVKPDLVLLDLLLPKFSGDEVLQYIRANKNFAAIPVIVLSTNSIDDAAHEHLLESASRRILKSLCTPAILLTAVQEVLAENTP